MPTLRKPRPFRLKCSPGNFQCGSTCQPITYKSKAKGFEGERRYTNCGKNATGMPKTGLEYLQARQRRVDAANAYRGKKGRGNLVYNPETGEAKLPPRAPAPTKAAGIETAPVEDPWNGPSPAPTKAVQSKTPAQKAQLALPPAKNSPAPVKPQNLPSPNTPISVSELDDMGNRIADGNITPEEIQNNWERFKASKSALEQELKKLTLDQLQRRYHSFHRLKKAQHVNHAIRKLGQRFNPDNSIQFNPMEDGAEQRAMEAKVKSWTPEKIQGIAAEYRAADEKAEARRRLAEKSMKNPETLEEFDLFAKVKGEDKLSPEQLERYDDLKASAGRETRRRQEEAKPQPQSTGAGVAGLGMVEGFHTKHQQPLYTVTLPGRVDSADYAKLKGIAKGSGGYYYKAYGSTPAGFQFRSADKATAKANAEAFMAEARKFFGADSMTQAPGSVTQASAVMTQSDGVVTQAPGAKTQAKQTAPQAQKLRDLAQSTREKAEETLGRGGLRNTERRARMGANIDDQARRDIALADTMDNLADAIETGAVKYLDKITTKADVVQLNELVRDAHYNAVAKWARENPNATYNQKEDRRYQEPTQAEMSYAAPLGMQLSDNNVRWLANEIEDIPGLKLVASRLRRRIGLKGEMVDLSDPQATKDMEAIAKKFAGKNKQYGSIDRALDEIRRYRRLQRMGITNDSELRAALREFLQYRGKKGQEDPILKLERELIGRKIDGYFPTPKPLAARVAALAGIEDGDRVLEPSAGKGSLLDAVRDLGKDVQFTAVERDYGLSQILEAKGYDPIHGSFLDHEGEYDKIVMNPPFEKGQDMDHVQKAYELLAPGGRLVAIMGAHGFFASDKQSREFRDWLDSTGADYEKLPDGSFKTSDNPTGVATYLVELNKPGAKSKPAPVGKQDRGESAPIQEKAKYERIPDVPSDFDMAKQALTKMGIETWTLPKLDEKLVSGAVLAIASDNPTPEKIDRLIKEISTVTGLNSIEMYVQKVLEQQPDHHYKGLLEPFKFLNAITLKTPSEQAFDDAYNRLKLSKLFAESPTNSKFDKEFREQRLPIIKKQLEELRPAYERLQDSIAERGRRVDKLQDDLVQELKDSIADKPAPVGKQEQDKSAPTEEQTALDKLKQLEQIGTAGKPSAEDKIGAANERLAQEKEAKQKRDADQLASIMAAPLKPNQAIIGGAKTTVQSSEMDKDGAGFTARLGFVFPQFGGAGTPYYAQVTVKDGALTEFNYDDRQGMLEVGAEESAARKKLIKDTVTKNLDQYTALVRSLEPGADSEPKTVFVEQRWSTAPGTARPIANTDLLSREPYRKLVPEVTKMIPYLKPSGVLSITEAQALGIGVGDAIIYRRSDGAIRSTGSHEKPGGSFGHEYATVINYQTNKIPLNKIIAIAKHKPGTGANFEAFYMIEPQPFGVGPNEIKKAIRESKSLEDALTKLKVTPSEMGDFPALIRYIENKYNESAGVPTLSVAGWGGIARQSRG